MIRQSDIPFRRRPSRLPSIFLVLALLVFAASGAVRLLDLFHPYAGFISFLMILLTFVLVLIGGTLNTWLYRRGLKAPGPYPPVRNGKSQR